MLELNGGPELNRLSVQARGNRITAVTSRERAVHPPPGGPGGPPGPRRTRTPSRPLSSAWRSPPCADGGVRRGCSTRGRRRWCGRHRGRRQGARRAVRRSDPAPRPRSRRACAPRILIALLLHGRPVHTERHVVEERAPVHVAEVDGTFERIGERVERPDEVIRVQAQVAGEVVPGPGRNAYERDSMGGCGGRHDRQRSVSARHAEYVGPARRSFGCEGAKVVARPQTIGSIPCSRAASTSPACPARPPPDFGLMNARAAARRQRGPILSAGHDSPGRQPRCAPPPGLGR